MRPSWRPGALAALALPVAMQACAVEGGSGDSELARSAIVQKATHGYTDYSFPEQTLIAEIQELRIAEGLPPLTASIELTERARDWAERMKRRREVSFEGGADIAEVAWSAPVGDLYTDTGAFQPIDTMIDPEGNALDPSVTTIGVGFAVHQRAEVPGDRDTRPAFISVMLR